MRNRMSRRLLTAVVVAAACVIVRELMWTLFR